MLLCQHDNNPMSRLLHKDKITIKDSKSVVSFDKKGGGDWEVWNRYISIEGKPAYEIGNICGTCSFYFERLEGANQSVNTEETIQQLNDGLSSLDRAVVEKVSAIIPDGNYEVLLLNVFPKLVTLGTNQDYFANEEVKLWGIDGFWGMPHHPKVRYYRGTDQNMPNDEKLFEFLVPIFPQTWLEPERVAHYKAHIESGKTPTAISLSVLDIKAPAMWIDDIKPEFTGHWCLAHYILDGHHKMFAAAELNKPLRLLSFLATEESICDSYDNITQLLSAL